MTVAARLLTLAPDVAPTNRQRSTPNSAHLPPPLVDTIAVRGRVGSKALTTLPVQRRSDREGRIFSRRAETELSSGVKLRVDDWRGRLEALVEFSVPRLLTGSNQQGSSLFETHEVLVSAYQEASDLVDWECSPEALQLMRLDLVRDFGAAKHEARLLLSGLAQVPASRARTVTEGAMGSASIQTLYRKTDRWAARLYDRSGVCHEGADITTLRYELQLRSPALRREGLDLLSDLEEHASASLLLRYFQRCRFHVPVGAPFAKVSRVMQRPDLTQSERRGMLGQVQMDAWADLSGQPVNSRDATAVKHRKRAADNGLVGWDLADHPEPVGPRLYELDYASGLLVAA